MVNQHKTSNSVRWVYYYSAPVFKQSLIQRLMLVHHLRRWHKCILPCVYYSGWTVDFTGTPSSALDSAAFDPYNPIKVEPTYPIWIIETIPGLVTLGCVCLVFLTLCVAVSVFVCYRKDWCCFKPKYVHYHSCSALQSHPTTHTYSIMYKNVWQIKESKS